MKTKLTATFSILLIALMITGIGYALWDKNLHIHGTVNTGKLDGIVTYWFSNDPPGTLDPRPEGATYPPKDVGETICTIDAKDQEICYVTINHGYPSYNVHFSITIKNTGNVAWKIQGYTVDSTIVPENTWVKVDLDGDGKPDIEFYITDSIGEQVEPGQSKETSMDIHVLQTATPGSTYYFTFKIQLVQWNEYVPPP
ncbi:MAG: hypothetical protein QW166_05735 [Candidatus Bathyarchaeia archaeon]